LIVVDSSALIAIALAEPETERCMHALHDTDRVLISAATVAETLIVAFGRECEAPIRGIFDRFGLVVEPLTEVRARAAADAYRRYGKGWHAAALNYGDCFAYALAIEHGCPLLYVGEDFRKTDVASALAG
jgi:ribonuclease VapC